MDFYSSLKLFCQTAAPISISLFGYISFHLAEMPHSRTSPHYTLHNDVKTQGDA